MKLFERSLAPFRALLLFLLFLSSVSAQEVPCPGQKSPILSCGLSCIIPSLGQFYNDQPVKGTIVLSGIGLGALLAFSDAPLSPVQRGLSDVLIAGSYLFSILDAPISSEDINGEIQRKCREGKTAWGMGFQFQETTSNSLVPMGNIVLKL